MSVKNIKIAVMSAFILSVLVVINLYLKKSLNEFSTELENSTKLPTVSNKVEPIFYNLKNNKITAPESTKKVSKKLYTIELGVTPSLAMAKQKLHELKKLKLDAYFTPLQQNGKTYYRLRFGIFQEKEKALTSAKFLSDKNINASVRAL